MARITGVIEIDFDTENCLTKQNHDQFVKFKKELEEFIKDHLQMAIYEIGVESGLQLNSYPVTVLGSLFLEFDAD